MNIWVDADACPVVIKEILFRAADRTGIIVTLVANKFIKVPRSKYIKTLQVGQGFDKADDEIINQMSQGDLIITADIPLASEVIENKGIALNPRGLLYSEDNIKEKLNMRDFMETLRAGGIDTKGPPVLGEREKQKFANNLDKIIVNYQKSLK
ncbi:MAG: YaiI/YqxD family protein [Thermodesulfobacteriota bacterium]